MTSKIKVDNINKVSDDSNIINKCGTAISVGASGNTVAVTGNDIRSDSYKAADGGVIASQSGTTITLGASGDTVTLAAGASQSGFGRTGTVDWITTPKVTGDSPVTAVSGNGYFLNTSAGTITLNLPAGSAGDIISLADYAATWQTSAVTVVPNGTDKLGGTNASTTLAVEGQSVTFVFVDSTQGWINTMDSTSNVRGGALIAATVSGACNTLVTAPCCANVKIATFINPGTFCVSAGAGPLAVVDYMVVAGGGGGGGGISGGGGAGGYREAKTGCNGSYTASPLATPTGLPLSPGPYSIAVGGGGTTSPTPNEAGNTGDVSTFSTITSAGGGGGAGPNNAPAGTGGSGGGGAGTTTSYAGGAGNTPPVSPSQGNNGGDGISGQPYRGAGGGGAGAVGSDYGPTAGPGGAGVTSSITASPVARAGGGGGGGGAYGNPTGGTGGTGGGGPGKSYSPPASFPGGAAGTANTGGGGGAGGGGEGCATGFTGGSGIVVIRYKFQ